MLHVISANYVDGYRLHVQFSNGDEGIVDLADSLWGEVFEPLKNVSEFRQFELSPTMHTICWPNANLAPEYLHAKFEEQSCGHAVPVRSFWPESHILHVTGARYVGDYRVWIEFSDGTSGEADLSVALWGPMFEPLKDKAYFAQVKFDPEMDTVVWPNGADLAAEYLKDLVLQQQSETVKAS